GGYDTSRYPHVDLILKEIDNKETILIILKTASQTSKTTIAIGSILKLLDTEPADAAIVFPTDKNLPKMYKGKVEPLLDGCETISKKLEATKAEQKSQQRAFSLKINNEILYIIGVRDGKSISTRYMAFDEAVEFPEGMMEETMERAKSFDSIGSKIIVSSTVDPDKQDEDIISEEYESCEVKMQYQFRCKECNELFYPEPEYHIIPTEKEWREKENIPLNKKLAIGTIKSKYGAYARNNNYLECPHCKYQHNNKERSHQIYTKQCDWVEVEPKEINEEGKTISWKPVEEPTKNYRSIGFDINTLCICGYDMGNIAEKRVKNEYSSARIAQQSMLWVGYYNRTYKTSQKNIKKSDVIKITNYIPQGIVKDNTEKLYFTIDTQKGYYYYHLVAVSENKEYNTVFFGKAENEEQLENLMFREYYTQSNTKRKINRVTIDRRGFQQREQIDEATGEVIKSQINTTTRINQLVRTLNKKAIQKGYPKDFVWASEGVEQIGLKSNDLKNENSTGKLFRVLEEKDPNDPENSIKIFQVSNRAAKKELNIYINNAIENAKKIEEGEEPIHTKELYYVNHDM
ncbi:MAG: phage terminase large subunit family protein, partial [Campylobacterales bacterium]|nr:phage terminase large subunit family protein [Campylobacterales bacterium]